LNLNLKEPVFRGERRDHDLLYSPGTSAGRDQELQIHCESVTNFDLYFGRV
jgi:hypothetical protein